MTQLEDAPELPLTITSHRTGDAWTFGTLDELLGAVAAFSTDDPAQAASVIDGRGRLTRLVIENHQVAILELLPGWPSLEPF
jgi:hypothetical protein